MWEWIEQLREKPEPVRRKIALMTALGMTLFIVVVWLLVLAFSTRTPAPTYSTESETVTSLKGDIELLKNAAREQRGLWEGFKGLFEGTKEGE